MKTPRIIGNRLELPRRNEIEVFFPRHGLFTLVLEEWTGALTVTPYLKGWIVFQEESGFVLYRAGHPLLSAFTADPTGVLAKDVSALAVPEALTQAKKDGSVTAIRRYGTLYGGRLATPPALTFQKRETELIWPYRIQGSTAYGDSCVHRSLARHLFGAQITITNVDGKRKWDITETLAFAQTEWFVDLPEGADEEERNERPKIPTLDFAGLTTSAT